ncbi:proline-rich domain-containing protein [Streptomyces sp. NBC_01613]|uniref:proline-rich domain-containing protein n=1 Tax=Streptomyces sp. NBC_01613 TaxID=2975896 RepID=UPI0038640702
MSNPQGSWTGGTLTARTFLKPHQVARAVFHPAWIPEAVDPSVEQLKRVRVIAGAVAALGVYTFVEGGFAFDEMLDNAATASAVLFFLTPLTVGVMLYVWRRGGTVRQLREPLVNSLKLLLLFIGSVFTTVLLFRLGDAFGVLPKLVLTLAGLWMAFFAIAGAVKLSGNFFGSAAVHRGLPPLLATVTTWLMAIPDLVTGDLHGLSLTMGIVFILGAPVTVTGISLLELRRLRRRYGVRLTAHPATLPRIVPQPLRPPQPPQYAPNAQNGFLPPQGNPYGSPYGNPYGQPQGNPYGGPFAPGPGNPYGPRPPYNPQNPYGS